jgi:hypothetical protein
MLAPPHQAGRPYCCCCCCACCRLTSHNAVGCAGNARPQVRALLCHGARDGGACTHSDDSRMAAVRF